MKKNYNNVNSCCYKKNFIIFNYTEEMIDGKKDK